jgi:hypothetical protein
MNKIVSINVNGKDVLIESESITIDDDSLSQMGGIDLSKNLSKMLEIIKPFCESIVSAFDGLIKKPKSVTAEFGLTVAGEGNFLVIKASGEGTVKITLNWDL